MALRAAPAITVYTGWGGCAGGWACEGAAAANALARKKRAQTRIDQGTGCPGLRGAHSWGCCAVCATKAAGRKASWRPGPVRGAGGAGGAAAERARPGCAKGVGGGTGRGGAQGQSGAQAGWGARPDRATHCEAQRPAAARGCGASCGCGTGWSLRGCGSALGSVRGRLRERVCTPSHRTLRGRTGAAPGAIRSDNVGALILLSKLKTTSARNAIIAREFALDLGDASFAPRIIEHIPGVTNVICDSLSRLLDDSGKYKICHSSHS